MHELVFPYQLRRGHTDDPSEGACAMDAINWLVHGKHGDMPECACPLIACYVIKVNDLASDTARNLLLPYLHRIAGSRSLEHQPLRGSILIGQLMSRFFDRTDPSAREYPPFTASEAFTCAQDMIAVRAYSSAMNYAFRAIRPTPETERPKTSELLAILDEMLCAGPEGEPWSVDVVDRGVAAFELARTQGLQTQC